VFVADLKTTEHPSHWILQGVALVLNVDYWSIDMILNPISTFYTSFYVLI
jgi:hypothetical protein